MEVTVVDVNTNDYGVKAILYSKAQQAINVGHDAAGRVYTIVKKGCHAITQLFGQMVDIAARVTGSAEGLQKAVQFTAFAVMANQIYSGSVGDCGTKVCDSMNKVDSFIDLTGICRDLPAFLNGSAQEDIAKGHKFAFMSKVSLFLADIGSIGLWLGEVGVINLGKCAASIGRLPIFSLVQKISLLAFTRTVAMFGFGFLGINALIRLGNGENVTTHLLTLTQCVAEVALKTFLIAGCVNPVTHVALGLVAAGFGLASFIYGEYHPAQQVSAVA